MSIPLVSVVIPTCARPQYLPRAVESALTCQGDSVEVIVVPNGPDESWKQSLSPWASDSRVRVSPIATAHGNVARNHGMLLARGKYLRFLDDDDYLLPEAIAQITRLEMSGADVCSGRVRNVGSKDSGKHLLSFPNTKDFVCAAVSFTGFVLPTTNVFRRQILSNCSWDQNLDHRQDFGWMLDIVSNHDFSWIHLDKPIGVWFQHENTRVSSPIVVQNSEIMVVTKLTSLYDSLSRCGRINAERNEAIANSLWHHVHRGFPYHPIYWSHIARVAQDMCNNARPPLPILRSGMLHSVNPIFVEWLLFPVRKVVTPVRRSIAKYADRIYDRDL